MTEVPTPLWDIHCHVLPDIDDGPEDEETALAVLESSAARGVTGMVVTPHSQHVTKLGGIPVLNDRLGRMRARLEQHSIPLELLPGMEIRLLPDVPDQLSSGQLLPLAGTSYVLVELDYTQWAEYTNDVLFEIAVAGFTPILAHVERIVPLQEHPERVIEMVGIGYYAQITAMSMLGGFGPIAKRTSEYLLGRGAVHVIASDTHALRGNRQPWPRQSDDKIARVTGEEAAHTLIYGNPARAVAGERLLAIEPRPAKRRWGFLPF